MQNENLVKAIVDLAVFLEFSDEDSLNPDASMAAMEQLSSTLKEMPHLERLNVVQAIQRMASGYGERANFVSALPEALDLL
jgi:hypothetical protein